MVPLSSYNLLRHSIRDGHAYAPMSEHAKLRICATCTCQNLHAHVKHTKGKLSLFEKTKTKLKMVDRIPCDIFLWITWMWTNFYKLLKTIHSVLFFKHLASLTSLELQRRSAMALARGQSLGVKLTEFTNSLQMHVSPEKHHHEINHFWFVWFHSPYNPFSVYSRFNICFFLKINQLSMRQKNPTALSMKRQ